MMRCYGLRAIRPARGGYHAIRRRHFDGPDSETFHPMYVIAYFCAIIGLIVTGIFIVIGHIHSGRFFGSTLSQWVEKTRKKTDEVSADKLRNVRKLLEVLAHDIIKHRLLGLHSLFKEMHHYYEDNPHILPDGSQKDQALDRDMAFRDEFFRICGLKARPEERLWNRWINLFSEIYHYTGKRLVIPLVDPMFASASKLMFELKRAMVWFINAENAWKLSSKRFRKLNELNDINGIDVYPAVLELAASCRMEIDPDNIIESAIESVSSQAGRSNVASRIRIYTHFDRKLLCDAPTGTLVMCLMRLIDNALEQGDSVAIDAAYAIDDFTATGSIIFKVYDMTGEAPTSAKDGMGLRGVKQNLEPFNGGVLYRKESRDEFKKAAIMSISASEYKPMKVTTLNKSIIVGFVMSVLFSIIIFIGCLLYVLGGPPVEFAGKGTDIVEFYVEVGHELSIPLCKGGRNVHAEVEAANAACTADQCTFADVLDSLAPCTKSMGDPQCPGAIKWTPQFVDGQRQGRNYEISVKCIANSFPPSEDIRRIRVLVTRPNSPPQIIFAQVINETTGHVDYVQPGNVIKTGVDDKLRLRILASDADADAIVYRLKQPDGKQLVSNDGNFILQSSWSLFGTSTFDVELSDNVAAPVKFKLILEASQLHAIDVPNIDISSPGSAIRTACEGSPESRICRLPDNNTNEMSVAAWFDPLQPKIRPLIEFNATDSHMLGLRMIRTLSSKNPETIPGDQWEIYSLKTQQLFAVLELTNIQKLSAPGLYHFTFRILTNTSSFEGANLAINMAVSELSGRIPAFNSFIIFSFMDNANTEFSFVSRNLQLTEYDEDADQPEAEAETWIYPRKINRSMPAPAITSIECQTPEFAQAFEQPEVRNLKNAWRLGFKLKRGCIPGLTDKLSARQRLCSAHLSLGNNREYTDDIWIMLESRDCAPKIESLSLISTQDEIAQNNYKYRFHIVDTDNDLSADKIEIKGLPQFDLIFDPNESNAKGSYTGTLHLNPDCARRTDAPIVLSATDNAGLSHKKTLILPQSCPSLIATASGLTSFTAEEGELIEIPLKHDKDTAPVLLSQFGMIRNDAFVWTASCSYGKGPLSVEIASKSPNRYGDPLRLKIELICQPRFSLSLDDKPMTVDAPIAISPNQTRRLEIIADGDMAAYSFIPQTPGLMPKLSLVQSESPQRYTLDISCNEINTSEELRIQIMPKEDAGVMRIEPIQISVQCLDNM